MSKLKYRIRRLFVENVKRIRMVEVIPKDDIVEIAGENAQGKSSVLDSIIYVLGGKEQIPSKPIREGEKSARIILETDDFIATRTWTDNDKTYLKVAANTGKSPQAFLDSKISKISFDPVEFARMDPKHQEQLLRQVTGLNTANLEEDKVRVYELRKTIGREVERLKVFRNELGQPVYDLPTEEISSGELLRKIDDINSDMIRRNQLLSKVETYTKDETLIKERIKIKVDEMERLANEVNNLEKSRKALIGTIGDLKSEASKIAIQDATPIKGELMELEEKNKLIRKNVQINKIQNEWDDKQAEYNEYTEQIREIDNAIQDMIINTKFPVDGLTVSNEGIVFNGIPLTQASQAEQIRIGLAIAESLNPELQIVLIKDGSLLDKKSTSIIREFARAKGCQIWIERVEPSSEDAIIIEDGGIANA